MTMSEKNPPMAFGIDSYVANASPTEPPPKTETHPPPASPPCEDTVPPPPPETPTQPSSTAAYLNDQPWDGVSRLPGFFGEDGKARHPIETLSMEVFRKAHKDGANAGCSACKRELAALKAVHDRALQAALDGAPTKVNDDGSISVAKEVPLLPEEAWNERLARRLLVAEVLSEMERQDKKYGVAHDGKNHPNDWIAVLAGRLGRVFDASNDAIGTATFRRRLIQLAAVALAAVRAMDR